MAFTIIGKLVLVSLSVQFWCDVGVVSGGSCGEAKLCCTGRDSSCVVQKAPINAINEDLSDKPCYCDHACLKLGDCCPDFKDACGVVDCQVTSWGPWSPCDADCGPGTMSRSRSIRSQPQNGGRHCPSLEQRRSCEVSTCFHHPDPAIKETTYAFFEEKVDWIDAMHFCQKNKMELVKFLTKEENYQFETWVVQNVISKAIDSEIAMLLPGSLSQTRKANTTSDIRKNLKVRDPSRNPQYDPKKTYCVEFEVLKASKACRKEPDYKALKEGDKVCIHCESEALHENLGWRCQGHGVEGRVTRWSALSAPHCHGKWLRASADLDRACVDRTCKDPATSFIFV